MPSRRPVKPRPSVVVALMPIRAVETEHPGKGLHGGAVWADPRGFAKA